VSRGRREFLRFAAVGAGGFTIDVVVFLSMLAAGSDPYVARGVSAFLAVTATWWFNKEWTFRAPGEAARRGTYPAYLAVQSGGLVVNYGVFAAVQAVIAGSPVHPLAALAAGAAAALLFNFAGARGIVFRRAF
jgi:putative flippase GtrA